MNLIITERMKKIKPSPTLALSAKAQDLAAKGLDVISLTVGEPDWNTVAAAREAATIAMEKGFTKYAPAGGILSLRKAISEQFKSDYGVEYSPDEITVSAGGKFILHGIMESLIDKEDQVVIPAPYWVSYPTLVEMAGGHSVFVTCDEKSNFKITPPKLDKAMNDKTKIVVLNSPSNPTGLAYTDDECRALGEVLLKHPNVILVTDDIYNRLYFKGDLAPHILKFHPQLKNRTVVVNGASKTYSMTGWRVGWAMGPKELIQTLNKFHTQTVSCANSIAQHATLAAIQKGQVEVKKSVVELEARMRSALKALRSVPHIHAFEPDGAFYFWIDIRECLNRNFEGRPVSNSTEFCAHFLESENVAVVPGVEFGLEGYIRASYAVAAPRMLEAIGRMSRFIAKLQ